MMLFLLGYENIGLAMATKLCFRNETTCKSFFDIPGLLVVGMSKFLLDWNKN